MLALRALMNFIGSDPDWFYPQFSNPPSVQNDRIRITAIRISLWAQRSTCLITFNKINRGTELTA